MIKTRAKKVEVFEKNKYKRQREEDKEGLQRTMRPEINIRGFFSFFRFLFFSLPKYSSPLVSSPLSFSPLPPSQTGFGSEQGIVEDCQSSLSFDEFPQERAKQIQRLAQLYSLLPDSPSECELSAYICTIKTNSLFGWTLSLQQFLSSSSQQDDITSSVVQSSW